MTIAAFAVTDPRRVTGQEVRDALLRLGPMTADALFDSLGGNCGAWRSNRLAQFAKAGWIMRGPKVRDVGSVRMLLTWLPAAEPPPDPFHAQELSRKVRVVPAGSCAWVAKVLERMPEIELAWRGLQVQR